MTLATNFIEHIAEQIATANHSFLPHGSLTKSALLDYSANEQVESVQRVDLREHAGLISYDPSEFLITARSGTLVKDTAALLSEHGQYLPFDPLFVNDNATLGGSLASGISGPNRLLYGGIRDFVMEVELLDGLGRLVRGGGKVVKNAAGFDLPKLMVGSYGRLGILTEVTLKVFPQPIAFATLTFQCQSIGECVSLSQSLQSKPLPICALDFALDDSQERYLLHVRFAGPADALNSVVARAREQTRMLMRSTGEAQETETDVTLWSRQAGFVESPTLECVVRVATNLTQADELQRKLLELAEPTRLLFSAGGAVAYLQANAHSLIEVDGMLRGLHMPAVILKHARRSAEVSVPLKSPCLGDQGWRATARRIQQAMDPHGRFVSF
jgi:glycolate oxidase FAD binding subunit